MILSTILSKIMVLAVVCCVALGSAASTHAAPRPETTKVPAPFSQTADTDSDASDDATPAPDPDAAIFSDGFESTGDLSQWSSERFLTVEQGAGYEGGYAARATSTGAPAYAVARLPEPAFELHYRIRMKIMERGPNPVTLMQFRTVGGQSILSVFVGEAGTLGYRTGISGQIVQSEQVVSTGEWHELQVRVLVESNSSQIDVWLDDKEVSDLEYSLWLGPRSVGRVELGENTAGRTYDVLFDDVIVDSGRIAPSRQPDPVSERLLVTANPAIAGLRFELDGETFFTNEVGVAQIEVREWSPDLQQRIQVPDTELVDGEARSRASFWGWDAWIGSSDSQVSAFFDLKYPVTWSFEDSAGKIVDPSTVTSITVKNSLGFLYTFEGEQARSEQYLLGSRVAKAQTGNANEPIHYSIQDVVIRGASVVYRGRQEFPIGPTNHWDIRVLLYSVTIHARDALFGFPVGSAVTVIYPDGATNQFPLDADQQVTLESLPRGEYQLSVVGPGFSPFRPLSLSRTQAIDLEVITYTDMAVVMGLFAAFVFGLLFAGRPGLLLYPFRMFGRNPTTSMNTRS